MSTQILGGALAVAFPKTCLLNMITEHAVPLSIALPT